MKISQLFSQLSYGELSNLTIGDDGSGNIAEQHYPKLIYHAQQALTNLYSRFANRKAYIVVQQDELVQKYRIHPLYAVTDTTPNNTAPRHIIDTEQSPFTTPIIKILSIRKILEDSTLAEVDLLINDDTRVGAVKTLAYDEIYIREPIQDEMLLVEVQLNHSVITLPVDLDYEISLAPVLEEALVLKVAARVFGSMNGQDNMIKAQSLNASYENVLQMVQFEDLLQNTSTEDHSRFVIGGWV